ncbi:hypothetical protein [Pseudomonas sp. BN102]|uniref:hypothetical protein n=1 Tax=Pseudomonas sp. BN102 TaxID=2567886 RepID=UPI002456729B|nr:hypothetical protein [Pseudomonas sp. BN102]
MHSFLPLRRKDRATFLHVVQLRLALLEQELQVRQPGFRSLPCGICRRHLLPRLGGGLPRGLLDVRDPRALGLENGPLLAQTLLRDALRQQDRLLPHRDNCTNFSS